MAKLADALHDPLVTTVDLIRHGEPAGGEMYRGTQDDPLSDLGWQQMRTATQKPAPWQLVVSSPLKRCRAFAQELAKQQQLPLEIDQQFREICFGDWEGRRPAEINAEDSEQILKFWLDPVNNPPAGAEPFAEFSSRIQQAWQSLLQRYAGKHLLLVCHGGVIRAVLTAVTAMPIQNSFRWHVPYAGISRVRVYTEQGGLAGGRQVPTVVFNNGRLTDA